MKPPPSFPLCPPPLSSFQWDPDKWGIDVLSFKPGAIWRPDTRIYEEIEGEFPSNDVVVLPTGEAALTTPFKSKVTCHMDLSSFPMDQQRCDLTMGSWTWSNKHVRVLARPVPPSWWVHPLRPGEPADDDANELVPARAPLDLAHYRAIQGQSEFDLTAVRIISTDSSAGHAFSTVGFEFELRRGKVTLIFGSGKLM